MNDVPAVDHSRQDPEHCQVAHTQAAEQKRSQTHGAEQMLRTLAVADDELYGEQIEQPLAESRNAVLRLAVFARAMLYNDFARAKALRGRQHGNEAVQLAVQP